MSQQKRRRSAHLDAERISAARVVPYALRSFLRFSEIVAAEKVGLSAQHYQALLAVCATADDHVTINDLANTSSSGTTAPSAWWIASPKGLMSRGLTDDGRKVILHLTAQRRPGTGEARRSPPRGAAPHRPQARKPPAPDHAGRRCPEDDSYTSVDAHRRRFRQPLAARAMRATPASTRAGARGALGRGAAASRHHELARRRHRREDGRAAPVLSVVYPEDADADAGRISVREKAAHSFLAPRPDHDYQLRSGVHQLRIEKSSTSPRTACGRTWSSAVISGSSASCR